MDLNSTSDLIRYSAELKLPKETNYQEKLKIRSKVELTNMPFSTRS